MKIPQYFFSEWSWPNVDDLVRMAEQRTGFVRDEGFSGVNYSHGQDGWDLSQPNPIPEGMLRIWWTAKYQNEADVEDFISEEMYLEALELHLKKIGRRELAEKIRELMRQQSSGVGRLDA